MSKILKEIERNVEYFPKQSRFGEFVEIFEDDTKESIYIPCNCAFNCMILALKEKGHKGHVSIIHDRNRIIRKDGREEVYYAEYALMEDGKVHMVSRHGCYAVYAEREIA